MSSPRIITKEFIRRIYKSPGHPVAFSSPQAIYRFFNGMAPLSMIRDALHHEDSYTLHREYKKPKYTNPYYVYNRRKQFQADLIDIASLKRSNEGICFLLMIIDTFSRKIWVIPLKRKTGEETAEAFSSWIHELRKEKDEGFSSTHRVSILTDNGKEFLNKKVREVMKANNIKMDQTKNVLKASIAERANKSLQILIYKYLTDRGETRYIDVLPSLVKTYNNRKHRSLNYASPNVADKKCNEIITRSIHSLRYAKVNKKRTKKSSIRFKVGDLVRVKTDAQAPSSARRAYAQQFHKEYYKIIGVNRRMPIIMFELKHVESGENVEGGFYANELVHVHGKDI